MKRYNSDACKCVCVYAITAVCMRACVPENYDCTTFISLISTASVPLSPPPHCHALDVFVADLNNN